MKKALTYKTKLFYYCGKRRIEGKNEEMRGITTGLWGDCSKIWGDCTDLEGNCTGLVGDCTGVSGSIEECEITEKERKEGITISSLIKANLAL